MIIKDKSIKDMIKDLDDTMAEKMGWFMITTKVIHDEIQESDEDHPWRVTDRKHQDIIKLVDLFHEFEEIYGFLKPLCDQLEKFDENLSGFRKVITVAKEAVEYRKYEKYKKEYESTNN